MATDTNNLYYGKILREEHEGDSQGFIWDTREKIDNKGSEPKNRSDNSKGPRKVRPQPTDGTRPYGDVAPNVADPFALDLETRDRGLETIVKIRREHGWVDKNAGTLAVEASHEDDSKSDS